MMGETTWQLQTFVVFDDRAVRHHRGGIKGLAVKNREFCHRLFCCISGLVAALLALALCLQTCINYLAFIHVNKNPLSLAHHIFYRVAAEAAVTSVVAESRGVASRGALSLRKEPTYAISAHADLLSRPRCFNMHSFRTQRLGVCARQQRAACFVYISRDAGPCSTTMISNLSNLQSEYCFEHMSLQPVQRHKSKFHSLQPAHSARTHPLLQAACH